MILRETPLTVSRQFEIVAFLSLLSAAIGLRFGSLGKQPIWRDEAYSYYFSQLPIVNLLTTDIDVHPPLFYLIEKLGYSWEDVHEEAERLEHAHELADEVDQKLGHPQWDPHGEAIPQKSDGAHG